MDTEQQSTSAVNKPSGLPRSTRLPVPNTRASRLPLSKLQNHSDPPKPNDAAPRVQKKPSIPTFKKPNTVPAKPLSSRTNAPVPPSKPTSNSARAVTLSVRSASRNAQRPAPSAPTTSTIDRADEESHDQLSSLDSFRTASRQSSHDDPTPPASEYVENMEPPTVPKVRKQSRPSLSDRTIESLQGLPATPKDRRRSSFFSPVESPMGPPPRPASSMSRNGSNGTSRPGTSDGMSMTSHLPATIPKLPQSARPAPRSSIGSFGMTEASSTRRSLSGAFHAHAQVGKNATSQALPSPSPTKRTSSITQTLGTNTGQASKTVAARSSKGRPSLSDAFGPAVRGGVTKQKPVPTKQGTDSLADNPPATTEWNAPKKSSAALREQIAAARAAARKDKARHDSPHGMTLSNDDAAEFQTHADPFNQAPRDEKHMLRNRINAARSDGKLNIAAMGLKGIPDEVLKMYDAAAMEEIRVSWAEVVDLTRFIAADNAIEELAENVFPDKSFEEFDLDDQAKGNQFAGLEMLDLHGNLISCLPIGMRHLQRLTSLNLSHNKLDNSALDVISQIETLKDLKLGHNNFSGSLPGSICHLSRLESLDVQHNRLLSLPEAMRELMSLKVLNVSGNQLTALPMDALQDLRLIELDASANSLIASLFPMGGQSSHATLQILNVANNSLAALTFDETLDLPRLHLLDVSCNNLTGLPPMTGWTELITLLVSDNKIHELPIGFTSLQKVRNVNFTSNELKTVDPEIGRMDSLESLILASNPLRERKFLTMNASDIKRNLRARLGTGEAEGATTDRQGTNDLSSGGAVSFSPAWTLKANSSLDLSGSGHQDEVNDTLSKFLTQNIVRRLHLQSNALTVIPPALALGQDLRLLDISGNPFSLAYVTPDLYLPSLEELNISGCSITTLTPLTGHMQAPKLHSLNISANRLSGPLPILRAVFPALVSLMASDNRIRSITADSLQGLHTVNLASNDIEALPAEIGLLWDEGLHSLEIGRNAFRVPNYRILEKGTEATMRWLRNKLPAPEDAAKLEEEVF